MRTSFGVHVHGGGELALGEWAEVYVAPQLFLGTILHILASLPCVHWPAMSGFVTKFGQKRGAEVAQAPDDAKHYGCWLFFRDHVTHTQTT